MNDYDTDVYAWSQRQGGLLRRLAAGERVNDADLDWPNIAEEIETVGRSERAAVASHIATIIEHLIKLQASPATEPRPGWIMTIDRSRIEIERLLEDSPSLRRDVSAIVARETVRARRSARKALDVHREQPRVEIESLSFGDAQVLGGWSPDAD